MHRRRITRGLSIGPLAARAAAWSTASVLLLACSSQSVPPRPGPSWCPPSSELVVLHRKCPPPDPSDQPPILAPRGTPSCPWPGVIVCGLRLDDGPDGSIFACQRAGGTLKFDLRAPERRIVGQCTNDRADGAWLYYARGSLERTEHYRDGMRVDGTP